MPMSKPNTRCSKKIPNNQPQVIISTPNSLSAAKKHIHAWDTYMYIHSQSLERVIIHIYLWSLLDGRTKDSLYYIRAELHVCIYISLVVLTLLANKQTTNATYKKERKCQSKLTVIDVFPSLINPSPASDLPSTIFNGRLIFCSLETNESNDDYEI